MTVIPAYNRDYKHAYQVMKDWDDNKDFLIQDVSSSFNGKYINKEQATGLEIVARFDRLGKRTKLQ